MCILYVSYGISSLYLLAELILAAPCFTAPAVAR
nr:MAG TPA: hypothetical protein [Caudoviricetes sp.]